jgi:hypothetical protein
MNYLYGIMAVPSIIGLVQVSKQTGLPSGLAPLAALLFGLLWGITEVFSPGVQVPMIQGIFQGIGFGLSAAGLYSGVKQGQLSLTPNAGKGPIA